MPCARRQYPIYPARTWIRASEALGGGLVQLAGAAPLALKHRSSCIFGPLAFVTLPPLDLKLRHLRLARRSAGGFRRGFDVLNLDILPTASRGRDLIGLGF